MMEGVLLMRGPPRSCHSFGSTSQDITTSPTMMPSTIRTLTRRVLQHATVM